MKIVHWIMVALFSAAAVLLRLGLLAHGFDESGLPVAMNAQTLALPVLLVVQPKGVSITLAAELRGLLQFRSARGWTSTLTLSAPRLP